MSTGFNWFKSYEVKKNTYDGYWYEDYSLNYISGGDTSHSGGNIGKVQDLIEKYSNGKRIPSVCEDWIDSEDYKITDLIEPSEMSEICGKILVNKEVDEVDMRERIEWFKKLSDDGYYLTYDYE
jgi:hypothetical protein